MPSSHSLEHIQEIVRLHEAVARPTRHGLSGADTSTESGQRKFVVQFVTVDD
jgi:hypothetical protein